MEFRKNKLSQEDALSMDFVKYLSSIGIEPLKIDRDGYWYLALFQRANTLTFRVDRNRRSWHDHVLKTGGNLIDFGTKFFQQSVDGFLDILTAAIALERALICPMNNPGLSADKVVISDHELKSQSLFRYLNERRIDLEIARRYCREVIFKIGTHSYHGVGFKNDAGGYELRNPDYKTRCGKSDLTTIEHGANEAILLQSFTDFLSFLTLHKTLPEEQYDFVILNSIHHFQNALPILENYDHVKLYLPTSLAGQNCAVYAMTRSSKYSDDSKLYKNHHDLNQWMQNFGKPFLGQNDEF